MLKTKKGFLAVLLCSMLVWPFASFAQSSQYDQRVKAIVSRLVVVQYKFPRKNDIPKVLDMVGWVVDRDRVVAAHFPGKPELSVSGSPAVIIKDDSEKGLMLLRVVLPSTFSPIQTTPLPREKVLSVDRYDQKTITGIAKPPEVVSGHPGLLRFTAATLITIGGGIFSQDGRMITMAVTWGPDPKHWILVAQPEAFQSFIKTAQ